MMQHDAVICLLGPTASGKSAAALALAAHLPIEIITLDSAQAYREMDIGTAKPSAAERAAVPHHLIDILSPLEAYSAARFREDAIGLVQEIRARGGVPIIVGGTMLYFKALREGLNTLPAADEALRLQLREDAKREGWPSLHARLATLDPETAQRLSPNDSQRIERALEVVLAAGMPLSSAHNEAAAPAPFPLLPIALVPSVRSELHARIAQRFEAMLQAGLVEELEGLKQRYPLNADLPSVRCVGYRQAWDYLAGLISKTELRDRGIFATRQLCKRQLTWLRATPGLRVIDCLADDRNERVCALAQRLLQRNPMRSTSPDTAPTFDW
jgi:tRNA dimethylallyltransferase